MTRSFSFSDRDKADIVTLSRLGVGQIVIGNLYGCSSGPIKKLLVEAGEPPRRSRGRVREGEVVEPSGALASQVDEFLQQGMTLDEIKRLVACPLPQFLLCLSLSPWFSRCGRCHQRLRDCEESLWQHERNGICGKCVAGSGQRQKHTIHVALRDPEYAVVQALAKGYGLSARTFVRRCLMELVALEVAG